MALAVGTSLLIITLTSGVALAAHLASGGMDVTLCIALTLAAILGAVAGSQLHDRFEERALRRLFAALLLGVGLAMIGLNVAALVKR
jgi:uncharacterized membrane protein YfcA